MNNIIEEVLKLPREEKIKLYQVLQKELEWDDNVLYEDELTSDQWVEIKKRIEDMKNNKEKVIALTDHLEFIKQFGE